MDLSQASYGLGKDDNKALFNTLGLGLWDVNKILSKIEAVFININTTLDSQIYKIYKFIKVALE